MIVASQEIIDLPDAVRRLRAIEGIIDELELSAAGFPEWLGFEEALQRICTALGRDEGFPPPHRPVR